MTGAVAQSRAAVTLARLLAAGSVMACLVAVALALLAERPFLGDLVATPEVTVGVSFSIVGALLAGRHERAVGWLMLTIGGSAALYAGSAAAAGFLLGGNLQADASDPGAEVWFAWVTSWAWLPVYLLVLGVLPLILPNGRLLGARWRFPLWLAVGYLALLLVVVSTHPDGADDFPGLSNPMAQEAARQLRPALESAFPFVMLVPVGSGLVSVGLRMRRADAATRRQLGWVLYGVTVTVVLVLLVGNLPVPDWVMSLTVLPIPVGIGVAALRYRLYDLDLVVNRTLVAGALVAGSALTYAAVVGWLGGLLDTDRDLTSFLAAFVLALLFHPARMRVQHQIDRLFFGRRGDPLALVRDIDAALREAATPRDALAQGVEVIREGLRLTVAQARVQLPSGEQVTARAGAGVTATSLLLTLHGEEVGVLEVGDRARDSGLSRTDVKVLETLAGPLAAAGYALRHTGDLEDASIRLIEAREEERRRLRRDLHDGLGPQLAGVVMGVDSVRSAIGRSDPGRADALAKEVGERARTAVDDVRRLVSGLRPPVLDDLGLVGALRSLVPEGSGGPAIEVDGELTDLSAAVEVAAYRIASEAITNAVRHSGAETIRVRIARAPDALSVMICDDGSGIPDGASAGVGLASMRARAAELGGWCKVLAGDPHGTAVHAQLPLEAR